MRIAYLSPWANAAENQAYFSLASAGRSVGIDLISCSTPEDVEKSNAEFVLSVASSVPKVVDLPTYLTVHEPTKRFVDRAFYMQNLLSYDGFLTISESLERFVRDVCFGVGRYAGVGFYYNSPQTSTLTTDLQQVVSDGRLRVVYIGTNWDRRAPALLRKLDERGILRIHGPEASWSRDAYAGYSGPLPFDGEAPQTAYAGAGMGLVLLSAAHLREDVISNRILEITSVGAVAVCPSIPWIRNWFGDTVLYFTPSQSAGLMTQEIAQHWTAVERDPAAAHERAVQAREIFEQNFAAERMLANAVAFHEDVQRARSERRSRLAPEPRISVVVRCGGRRARLLQEAVDSIRNQSFGAFTVILSKYEDVDVSPLTRDLSGRIERFIEVATPGGTRAETLIAGLKEVDTEYFAILDDDDFWLSDHVETLFAAGCIADPDFDVAFGGSVSIAAEGTEIEKNLFWNRNISTFGFKRSPSTIMDVTSAFSSNCFVARSSLLPPDLESLGALETAEDSLVVAFVSRKKRPVFSYKPTAFFRRGYEGESDFAKSVLRERDLLSLHVRTGMLLSPAWLSLPSTTFPEGRGTARRIAAFARSLIGERRRAAKRAVVAARFSIGDRQEAAERNAVSFTRYLIGDCVVLARILIAAVTGRDHPSARKELLVSPLRSARRKK